VITDKIDSLLQGYPLTEAQRADLAEAIRQLLIEDRLSTLATIEQRFADTVADVQREIHPAKEIAGKTIRDLQQLARQRGIPYRNLTKAELVAALAMVGGAHPTA
jgi:hypothetical protein